MEALALVQRRLPAQLFPWALAAVVAGALLLPGLLFGAAQDAAVYTTVADQLRHGTLPYEGAWDHKPPGVYVVYALAQSVLPMTGPWTPVWILSLAAVLACAAITADLVRASGSGARVIAAGFAIVCLAIPPVAQGGGQTELIALVPGAGAFAVALTAARGRTNVAAGVLLGAALVTSLQMLPVAAASFVVVALRPRPLPRALGIVAGLTIVFALVAAALVGAGLMAFAVDAVVNYSLAYRAMNIEDHGAILAGALRGGVMATAVVILPAALGLLSALRSPGHERLLTTGCAVWLLAGGLWLAYQGRLEGHYVAHLSVPAGVLFALGTKKLSTGLASMPVIRWPTVALLSSLGVMSLSTLTTASLVVWDELRAVDYRVDSAVATMGSDRAIDGTVFVWGNRPHVYYASGRTPATRFIYLAPLTTPGYSSPGQIAEVMAQIRADPPAYFVDAGSASPGAPGLPALLIPRPLLAYGRDFDALDPLRRFVRQNYALIGSSGGWPVYAIREGSRRSTPGVSGLPPWLIGQDSEG